MPIKLYADHNVDYAIISGLRSRQIDVLTAFDDRVTRLSDSALLNRATQLKRVLFTQDKDFLKEASKRQRSGKYFSGVILGRQDKEMIGRYIEDLEYIAKVGNPEEFENRLYYLPL